MDVSADTPGNIVCGDEESEQLEGLLDLVDDSRSSFWQPFDSLTIMNFRSEDGQIFRIHVVQMSPNLSSPRGPIQSSFSSLQLFLIIYLGLMSLVMEHMPSSRPLLSVLFLARQPLVLYSI
jgi:hypothetical protein